MNKRKKKFGKQELVVRAYPIEFRVDTDETGIIEGTPIVFNESTKIRDFAGEYVERITAHALDSADLSDVLLFVNHDMNKIPLARSKNGKGTLQFTIDEVGMHVRAKLDTENNSEAAALYSAIQRGDISGMSFCFRIAEDNWEELDSDIPTRTINKISVVHEVSAVSFPAYPQTSINARSESEETDYSPLAEARKAKAEETAYRQTIEIERMKNTNIIKLIKEEKR